MYQINQIILQHLSLLGYHQTCLSLKQQIRNDHRHKLIQLFDQGSRKQFFALFQTIPPSPQFQKNQKQILLFYLHISFLVRLLKTHQISQAKHIKQERKAFQQFISLKGKQYTVYPQLLPFYSLAYIDNPGDYGPFSVLFSQQWQKQLRQRLLAYVSVNCNSTLQNIITNSNYCEDQNTQPINIPNKMQQNRIQNNLNNWFKVVKQISKAAQKVLKLLKQSSTHNMHGLSYLEQCINSYSFYYNKNFLQALNQHIEILKNELFNQQIYQPQVYFEGLNFEKIKKTLELSKIEQRKILLKGLQTKIKNLSNTPKAKRKFIILLQKYDFLHFRDQKFRLGSRLLQKQLRGDCLKVLIGIVCDHHGSKYILECTKLIKLLIVISRKSDKRQRERVLRILQRIVVYPSVQDILISEGVIDLIIKYINQRQIQDSAMTILFQLSQKPIGKDILQKADALKLYITLLNNTQQLHSKLLINLNIWILLERTSFKKRAQQLGLLQVCKNEIQQTENPKDVYHSILIIKRLLNIDEGYQKSIQQNENIQDNLLQDQGQQDIELQLSQGYSLDYFRVNEKQRKSQQITIQAIFNQNMQLLIYNYNNRKTQQQLHFLQNQKTPKKRIQPYHPSSKKKYHLQIPQYNLNIIKSKKSTHQKSHWSHQPLQAPIQILKNDKQQPQSIKPTRNRRNRLKQLNQRLERSQCQQEF